MRMAAIFMAAAVGLAGRAALIGLDLQLRWFHLNVYYLRISVVK